MPSEVESLTEKQAEVLNLVLRRMSSKEIGRELGISPKSVDKRIDAARVKLGAATRTEAARIYGGFRYGESFPAQTYPVSDPAESGETHTRTRSGGATTEGGSGRPVPTSAANHPGRPGVLWLDPKEIGTTGRLVLILAGSLAMAVLVLVGLGIAQGIQAVLNP